MPGLVEPQVVRRYHFTSESVCPGHPDKVSDQISDSILDACLSQDPQSKCAVETACKDNNVFLMGEVTTAAKVNYQEIVRSVLKRVGFDSPEKGIDCHTCRVHVFVGQQSLDIASGVHIARKEEDIGAGDQGLMFGYATDETPERHPAAHLMANKLAKRLTDVRQNGTLPYLRPDGKTQVTVEYELLSDGSLRVARVDTIVVSAQHDESVDLEQLRKDIREQVINPVISSDLLDEKTKYLINPCGRFVIGGPTGDAGLTGRKIIVDTYGGAGSHGGGCFSGKDASKVDRSGCYAARWVAKSMVDAGLCKRCLVQVSYAIGYANPSSFYIDTFGTGILPDSKLELAMQEVFDLRPGIIMRELRLCEPRFAPTACFGHFGRHEPEFTWEQSRPLDVPAIIAKYGGESTSE